MVIWYEYVRQDWTKSSTILFYVFYVVYTQELQYISFDWWTLTPMVFYAYRCKILYVLVINLLVVHFFYFARFFSGMYTDATPPTSINVIDGNYLPRHHAALNMTTCLWINFINFGRAGNRLVQIHDISMILSKCSGVATSIRKANTDPTVSFPPLVLATNGKANDYVAVLESAAQGCREINYEWNKHDHITQHCSPEPFYHVEHSWSSITENNEYTINEQRLPALLPHVFVVIEAWKYTFDTETMVMYFRGGDILDHVNSQYSQGPCSLFTESWKIVEPRQTMLIYDARSTINPCVSVIERFIPREQLVEPPCESAGCHMALVGRAPYLVISGVSTFATSSMDLFPSRRRVTFNYFCRSDPEVVARTLRICVNGSTDGLVPWNNDDATLQAMHNTPSKPMLGKFNKHLLQAYVNGK